MMKIRLPMEMVVLHPSARRLHEFAVREEGTLVRSRTTAHLAHCATCRAEVSAIRGVVAGVGALSWDLPISPEALDRVLGARVTGIRAVLAVPGTPAHVPPPRWLLARDRLEWLFSTISLSTPAVAAELMTHRPREIRSAPRHRVALRQLMDSRAMRAAGVIALAVLPVIGIAQVSGYLRHRAVIGGALDPRGDHPQSVTPSYPPTEGSMSAARSLCRVASLLCAASPLVGQTVRDSAGVIVVENPAPSLDHRAFHIGAAPVWRIVGDSTVRSTPLRMTTLVRLPDGRFVVNDGNEAQLRYYDAAGAFLQASGGLGTAGGLLNTAIPWIYRARGDSVIAMQLTGSAPIFYDDHGQFVRNAFPAGPSYGLGSLPAGLRGVFSDGTLAVDGLPLSFSPTQTWKPLGDQRDPRRLNLYLHFNADGTRLLDTLGIFPLSDRRPGYTFGYSPTGAVMSTTLPISGLRQSSLVTDGDRFVYAEGTTYEMRMYSTGGKLQRIIRAAVPPRPMTAEDIARVTADATKPLDDEGRATALQSLKQVVFPHNYAAFGRVLADDAHRLWVEAVVAAGDVPYWAVFDPDGRLLGTVIVPDAGRIVWIGEDQIAFTRPFNERLGSELSVYRLTR